MPWFVGLHSDNWDDSWRPWMPIAEASDEETARMLRDALEVRFGDLGPYRCFSFHEETKPGLLFAARERVGLYARITEALRKPAESASGDDYTVAASQVRDPQLCGGTITSEDENTGRLAAYYHFCLRVTHGEGRPEPLSLTSKPVDRQVLEPKSEVVHPATPTAPDENCDEPVVPAGGDAEERISRGKRRIVGEPKNDPLDYKAVTWFGRRLYLGDPDSQVSRLFWLLVERFGYPCPLGEVQRELDGFETHKGTDSDPDEIRKAKARVRKAVSKLRNRMREHGLDTHVVIMCEDPKGWPAYTMMLRATEP